MDFIFLLIFMSALFGIVWAIVRLVQSIRLVRADGRIAWMLHRECPTCAMFNNQTVYIGTDAATIIAEDQTIACRFCGTPLTMTGQEIYDRIVRMRRYQESQKA